jgi:hypothetical protein
MALAALGAVGAGAVQTDCDALCPLKSSFRLSFGTAVGPLLYIAARVALRCGALLYIAALVALRCGALLYISAHVALRCAALFALCCAALSSTLVRQSNRFTLIAGSAAQRSARLRSTRSPRTSRVRRCCLRARLVSSSASGPLRSPRPSRTRVSAAATACRSHSC